MVNMGFIIVACGILIGLCWVIYRDFLKLPGEDDE